jgi:hypothetical protein
MASCRRVSSSVQPTEKVSINNHPTISAPKPHMLGSPMTVRGGGVPSSTMAMMPFFRMGPPPRSSRCRCASLHHGLGLSPTEYKDVARTFVHHTRAPLGLRHPDPTKCAGVLGAVQGQAFGGREDAASLDCPCARRRVDVWVGTKKRLPGRTKKLTDKKMDRTLGAPP